MKKLWYLVFILPSILTSCINDKNDKDIKDYEGYTLIWSDEFDRDIDRSVWNFEIGDGTAYGLPVGWGNAEKQLYTSSGNNAIVMEDAGNSVLAITARVDGGGNYTSARLTTQNKVSVRFGRIEARIKVPKGRGLWPAFWMLGDNISEISWPGCGEIDIMEVIGHEPNVLHTTVHYTNGANRRALNGNGYTNNTDLSLDYHIYSVDWTPEKLTFLLDNKPVYEIAIEDDMKEFLRSFYIILNVAVGGNWPGNPDASTVFPQRMYVDWVRIYQNDRLINVPDAPPLNVEEESLGSVSGTLALAAFNESFRLFNSLILQAFGAGGEPNFSASDIAINGTTSLKLSYPGGNWGGAYFAQSPAVNASAYANGHLVFSMIKPANLHDAEIKLESVAAAKSLFLKDYTPTPVANGFVEYRIPMRDFSGINLAELRIPFALWNPVNAAEEFVPFDIIIDNIYLSE